MLMLLSILVAVYCCYTDYKLLQLVYQLVHVLPHLHTMLVHHGVANMVAESSKMQPA